MIKFSRRSGTQAILIVTLSIFAIYLLTVEHPARRSVPSDITSIARLRVLSPSVRTQKLATALSAWSSGAPPQELLQTASASSLRDAADALFRHVHAKLHESGVIDVGANKGYPVTRLALSASAKWVISVEPDDRNYGPLSRWPRSSGTLYKPVHGAVSDSEGEMNMAFHKERDDFTCFNCLNVSREEVTVSPVKVHTVDALVEAMDGDVTLLKTDTQGHEAAVLAGAEKLLQSGRVYAVLMEFDPKLLGKWENAEKAIGHLVKAGLRCVHLVFSKLDEDDEAPFFGREIRNDSAREFWEFVKAQDRYTDLFCLRR